MSWVRRASRTERGPNVVPAGFPTCSCLSGPFLTLVTWIWLHWGASTLVRVRAAYALARRSAGVSGSAMMFSICSPRSRRDISLISVLREHGFDFGDFEGHLVSAFVLALED